MKDSTQKAVERLKAVIKDFDYNLPAQFMDDFENFVNKWNETLFKDREKQINRVMSQLKKLDESLP